MPAPHTPSALDPLPRPVRWVMPGEPVTLQGQLINCGGFYLGTWLPSLRGGGNDGCLLEPQLAATINLRSRRLSALPLPPRYRDLAPEQRGALLQWLAGARKPDVPAAFGWWQLFSWERRLLIDGPAGMVSSAEHAHLQAELLRLRRRFSGDSGLVAAIDQLLIAAWLLLDGSTLPAELSALADRRFPLPLQLELAFHAQRGTPPPPDLLLRWIRLHPLLSRRAVGPAHTTQAQLVERLQQLPLRPPTRGSPRLMLPLLPCNPDLTFDAQLLPQELPDPFNDAAQLTQLAQLIDGPAAAPWDEAAELAQRCAAGAVLLPRADVARLAAAVGSADAGEPDGCAFAVVPNQTLHGPEQAAELLIYPPAAGCPQPSDVVRSHAAILRLAAAAASPLTATQARLLQSLIDGRSDLSLPQIESLQMLLCWAAGAADDSDPVQLAATIADADRGWCSGLLQTLQRDAAAAQQSRLAQVIALVDALQQPAPVAPQVAAAAAAQAEQQREAGQRAAHLDPLRLQRTEEETAAAQALLAAELSTDDADQPYQPLVMTTALTAGQRRLLEQLLAREYWPRTEAETLARAHRLMLDGAVEAINAWADALDYPALIEDTGDLWIDQIAAQEVLSNA
jgi:hypothetical protein